MFDTLIADATPADGDVSAEVLADEVFSDELAWLRHTNHDPVPGPVEALTDPAGTAATAARLAPGPDLLQAVTLLDHHSLDETARIDALVAIERHLNWLHATQQRLLTQISTRAVADPRDALDPSGGRWVREDVACALKIAGVTAQHRLDVAAALTGRLHDTLELLETGQLTYLQARTLAEETQHLTDTATAQVQARVLPKATTQTAGQFRTALHRAIAATDPRKQEERHRSGLQQRRVAITDRDDGMSELWALLPTDGAAILMTALNAHARTTHTTRATSHGAGDAADTRTADQRRADALIDLGITALNDATLPHTHGARPAINVTVALTTLLGDDNQPADLTGHGPIPASMARRLAADPTGTWHRLLTDPAGQLLDYGTTTYRPPADLTRHIITRDQTCAFPTCQRNATHCDLDHRIPYPTAGTNTENLQPLCRRHHQMKHGTRWKITRNHTTSTYHWTSPTGHHYPYQPPPLPAPTNPPDPDPGPDQGLKLNPGSTPNLDPAQNPAHHRALFTPQTPNTQPADVDDLPPF